MTHSRHYFVSGRVQGVWFRASTQQKARQLGLGGWVKNTPDGRVELFASGTEADLDTLEKWLWEGPPLARVETVIQRDINVELFAGFDIR